MDGRIRIPERLRTIYWITLDGGVGTKRKGKKERNKIKRLWINSRPFYAFPPLLGFSFEFFFSRVVASECEWGWKSNVAPSFYSDWLLFIISATLIYLTIRCTKTTKGNGMRKNIETRSKKRFIFLPYGRILWNRKNKEKRNVTWKQNMLSFFIGFWGFSRHLMDVPDEKRVSSQIDRVLLVLVRFTSVQLGFTGILPGFTEFYWVLPDSSSFEWDDLINRILRRRRRKNKNWKESRKSVESIRTRQKGLNRGNISRQLHNPGKSLAEDKKPEIQRKTHTHTHAHTLIKQRKQNET